jgi:hypothetical protein
MKSIKQLIQDAKEEKISVEDIIRIQESIRFWEIAYS